jgi:transcription initiation factor TFIID subunit 3
MSTAMVHHALLRPVVLQILRAAGFHAARPSVIDTLTEIMARYLVLLATRSAARAEENHDEIIPDISDVRLAMVDCGLLLPSLTSSEETWRELLRSPLDDVPERNGLRQVETSRRDGEDTNEIKDFAAWFRSDAQRGINRIAGLTTHSEQQWIAENAQPALDAASHEDYLTTLKKKHSKTGEESRFQGTVLGKAAPAKGIRIEGGPASLDEWKLHVMEQQNALHVSAAAREAYRAADDGDDSFASSATIQDSPDNRMEGISAIV